MQYHSFFRNWHFYTKCTSLFIPTTLTWHFEVCVRVCIVIVVLRSARGILPVHHVFIPYSGFVGPKLQTTNRIFQVKRCSKVKALSKDDQIDSCVENDVHETTVGVRGKAKLELDAVLQTKTGWKNLLWSQTLLINWILSSPIHPINEWKQDRTCPMLFSNGVVMWRGFLCLTML